MKLGIDIQQELESTGRLLILEPTPIQGESTKNCPTCGSENTHYRGNTETLDSQDIMIEEWECDGAGCGEIWWRVSHDDE